MNGGATEDGRGGVVGWIMPAFERVLFLLEETIRWWSWEWSGQHRRTRWLLHASGRRVPSDIHEKHSPARSAHGTEDAAQRQPGCARISV